MSEKDTCNLQKSETSEANQKERQRCFPTLNPYYAKFMPTLGRAHETLAQPLVPKVGPSRSARLGLRPAGFGRRLRCRRRAQSKSRLACAMGQTRPEQSNCDPRMLEWRLELRRTIFFAPQLGAVLGRSASAAGFKAVFVFFRPGADPVDRGRLCIGVAWPWRRLRPDFGGGGARVKGAWGACGGGLIGASFFCVSVLLRFCF